MKTAVLFPLALILGLTACGGRALAPDGLGGAAGSSAGAAGATTTTGAAGARTPLPVPASDAVERIAAVLWHQQADDATVTAASSLATKEDLEPIVRQMLTDPRATAGVGAFYRWWLDLDQVATVAKDPALFPLLSPELRADMVNETIAFGVDATFNEGRFSTYTTLLTASWTFVNERLANLYGIGAVGGDQLRRSGFSGGQRIGLLTQPSLLMLGSFATRTSPSHHGSEVMQKFFCEAIPPPPPNVEMHFTPRPGQTMRQALTDSIMQGGAACFACHGAFDGPGLALEGFSPIGAARLTDNGSPLDTTKIEFSFPRESQTGVTELNGPADLAHELASNVAAQDCYAQKWLTFALGRDLIALDQPSLLKIQARFKASGLDLQTLIVSVLLSDTFLTSP